jgi:hypothetical protein
LFANGRCPAALLAVLMLASCSLADSRTAERAKSDLIGLDETDLQSCLGVPDQHVSLGATDIFTYYATSTSSMSYTVPIVGGLGLSNSGYCHATFSLEHRRVVRILYSGEKNAMLSPDAYCAPILNTCLDYLTAHPGFGRSSSPQVGLGRDPSPTTP